MDHQPRCCYMTGWLWSVRHSPVFILSLPNSAASPQRFPKTVGSEAIGQTSLGTMLTRLKPLESTCALWSRVWPPTCLYSLCPAGLPLALSYHNRPFEGRAGFLLLLSTRWTWYYLPESYKVSHTTHPVSKKGVLCLWNFCPYHPWHWHCSQDKAKPAHFNLSWPLWLLYLLTLLMHHWTQFLFPSLHLYLSSWIILMPLP